jgi:hypothetical protein
VLSENAPGRFQGPLLPIVHRNRGAMGRCQALRTRSPELRSQLQQSEPHSSSNAEDSLSLFSHVDMESKGDTVGSCDRDCKHLAQCLARRWQAINSCCCHHSILQKCQHLQTAARQTMTQSWLVTS